MWKVACYHHYRARAGSVNEPTTYSIFMCFALFLIRVSSILHLSYKSYSFSFEQDIILNYVTDVVPENTPGYVIGTLSTIDDDSDDSFQNYNDEFKYVVVSDWNTFTVSGDKLIAKSSLDYETQDFYTVSIRSQDTSNYPKFLIKDFTIVVGDINEDPSKIELLPTQVVIIIFLTFSYFKDQLYLILHIIIFSCS
jgi:hypothetical protein